MDPLGRATCFSYDGANRLVVSRNPAQKTAYFKYDLTGNRTAEVDGILLLRREARCHGEPGRDS